MALAFPSEEWISAYKDAINANPAYRTAAADWTYGVVALICKAQPPGLAQDTGIWLDLEKGVCRGAKLVKVEEAMKAPFCITGEYARWKSVLRKELDPIKAMMQKKLELKGQMTTIVKYVNASKELVEAATQVPTRFLDEK